MFECSCTWKGGQLLEQYLASHCLPDASAPRLFVVKKSPPAASIRYSHLRSGLQVDEFKLVYSLFFSSFSKIFLLSVSCAALLLRFFSCLKTYGNLSIASQNGSVKRFLKFEPCSSQLSVCVQVCPPRNHKKAGSQTGQRFRVCRGQALLCSVRIPRLEKSYRYSFFIPFKLTATHTVLS